MPRDKSLGFEQKVSRVRKSPADYSTLPTHEESLFLHQNDYWIIQYHGRSALLKSTRGLYFLAALLSDPGREFHVQELLALPMTASTPAAAFVMYEGITEGLYAGITVLDARAKTEYKRRLQELRQELDEAERFNDPPRRTKAQDEMQMITDRLAYAVGVGGRDRKTSSDAERARCAVTKCIKKAIQRIGDAIPLLGYHLVARIKTGYFCSYTPHPERPVAWKC